MLNSEREPLSFARLNKYVQVRLKIDSSQRLHERKEIALTIKSAAVLFVWQPNRERILYVKQ